MKDHRGTLRARALKFVVLISVLSFFVDFVYEGSREQPVPVLLRGNGKSRCGGVPEEPG
jgi:hypothetical protein